MSYTTRCPACGTMFKVVPDQLKISDGWVRCGHCADVFDATLHLETWVPPTPPAAPPVPAQSQTTANAPVGTPVGVSAPPDVQKPPPSAERKEARPTVPSQPSTPVHAHVRSGHRGSAAHPSANATRAAASGMARVVPPPEGLLVKDMPGAGPAAAAPAAGADEPGETDFFSELQQFAAKVSGDEAPKEERLAEVGGPSRTVPSSPKPLPTRSGAVTSPTPRVVVEAPVKPVNFPFTSPGPIPGSEPASIQAPEEAVVGIAFTGTSPEVAMAAPSASEDEPPDEAEWVEPGFVQQARRRAYWESPAMRATLVSGVMLLSIVWAMQWAMFERNRLVAWKPSLQPTFQTLCGWVGCTLAPVQSIDDIVIDSTALVRRLGNFYSFDLVLKNTASMALAVPALELTLTDAADNVISRRVFLPRDMPGTPEVLAAGDSLPVSLRLSIVVGDSVPMSGYRALVFYP
jgi:predicted Zn finger-like uncharacterized protein